jgi:sulfite reductase (NADPH) flavoprotein alpha-component
MENNVTELRDGAYIPKEAPFSEAQRSWLNGYLAGLLAGKQLSGKPAEEPPGKLGPLLFLFGSQTGTAEGLARKFAKMALSKGFDARVFGLDAITPEALAKETRVGLITSTYGEGEMPDNAQTFWDALSLEGASRLEHLEYSVLALGDTNYAQFCAAGKMFDARLTELGARRVTPRVDCDTDYESPAQGWFDNLVKCLGADSAPLQTPMTESSTPRWTKASPFPARLKTNRRLNGTGSSKDTRHIEILFGDSGLSYEAGDALGVWPSNDPLLVNEILEAVGHDGEEGVLVGSMEIPLRKALLEHFELAPLLDAPPQKGLPPQKLIAPLRKLQPRLYSISSSPKAYPGEVHLTVGVVRYESHGRLRNGVCSTFLADRVGPETPVPIFVHSSPGFKPPVDPEVPMIMVGPGTGIAPFRAFLQERRAQGAKGQNWLFFGDQTSSNDFLYREELEAMLQEGFLSRLDTAFSRDQPEKIYVQHRMLEQATRLWSALQDGGHFYVCGDAKRMAKDVDAALHRVCEIGGGLSSEAAAEYVKNLKSQKRYQRDVY